MSLINYNAESHKEWVTYFLEGLKYGFFYPSSTIALRNSCLRYVVPAGSRIPQWLDESPARNDIAFPIDEYGRIQCRLSPRPEIQEAMNQLSVVPRILYTPLQPIKLIYDEEGLRGLFRGCTIDIAHSYLKNLCLHRGVAWSYIRLEELSSRLSESLRQRTGRDLVVYDSKDSDQLAEHAEIIDLNKASPIVNTKHIALRCAFETLLYPLFVVKNRMIVYEGPDFLGAKNAIKYTYKYDGICRGFFSGYPFYITSCIIRDAADLLCTQVCSSREVSKKDTEAFRNGLSTIIASIISPLTTIAIIQSTISKIPGLSEPDLTTSQICAEMPWNSILFSVALTLAYSGFTTLTMLENPVII